MVTIPATQVMAPAIQFREATLTQIADVRSWLVRQERYWEMLPRPQRMANGLLGELDCLSEALSLSFGAAGIKATTVLLDRLFSVLPMPPTAGLKVWIEILEVYPADVLKRAIDRVIATHKWGAPPLPAQVVEAAEADDVHRARQDLRREIQRVRQGIEAKLQRDRECAERELRRQNAVPLPKLFRSTVMEPDQPPISPPQGGETA